MLMKPNGPDQPPVAPGTPGHIGWHELLAVDGKSAFDFYAGQFGWTKGDAMDMGAMGIYQLFATGKDPVGGIMDKPANIPAAVLAVLFHRAGARRGRGQAEGARAARSCSSRWRCRAAPGSSRARTRKARSSR